MCSSVWLSHGDEESAQRKIWMGNKVQGRAITGGDVEEELVGGRGHVLPEEGQPHNHLQERTAQDRARHTGGVATVEGEWRQYKDAFVGVAEELYGRMSGKGGTPSSKQKPRMVSRWKMWRRHCGRSGKHGR